MNLLEGLYLHEIVLMILGIILFFVVVVLILRKGKKNIKLITGVLLISLIFIGFSAVKKIEVNGWLIELEHKMNESASDENKEEVAELLEQSGNRPLSNDSKLLLSQANSFVGNNEKAKKIADQVLSDEPNNKDAKQIKAGIEISMALDKLERSPSDVSAKRVINENINLLQDKKKKNPAQLQTLYKAKLYTGDSSAAFRYYDSIRSIDPRFNDDRMRIQPIGQ